MSHKTLEIATDASDLNQLLNDSWDRSQRYGLDRSDDDFPRMQRGYLNDVLAHNDALQQIAQPYISQLAQRVADAESVVILSDPGGLVLQTFGNLDAMHKAQRVALAPGNLWSECGRGTNAIGTALAIADRCEIKGQQHFLTRNQGLYCAAMPLQSPSGTIAGVLDISGPSRFPHSNTMAWVEDAVRQIEHQWVKHDLQTHQWLMSVHTERHRLDTPDEMLLIFADNTLMAANRVAMRSLNLTAAQFGLVTFQHLFPDLEQRHVPQPHPLESSAGKSYWYTLMAPQRKWVAPAVKPEPAAPAMPAHLQGEGKRILRLLNAGVSLCITGETGCGKEYLSQALYQQSQWRKGRFVAINCAALPETLIESELFGYQPGAFTGANKHGYIGKIREADGGVLFLDEIGDMPLALQTRLLRVLQEKEVSPLGETRSWPVEFAVICATHRNLQALVGKGEFREDLLYRLQEFTFAIPPLREWQDLPAFISQLWRDLGGAERHIHLAPSLINALSELPWPGNVRQLRSLLRVLLALADEGETLTEAQLPPEYQSQAVQAEALEQHSAEFIADTLKQYQGNVSKAAQALGVARSTLYRRAAKAQRSDAPREEG